MDKTGYNYYEDIYNPISNVTSMNSSSLDKRLNNQKLPKLKEKFRSKIDDEYKDPKSLELFHMYQNN